MSGGHQPLPFTGRFTDQNKILLYLLFDIIGIKELMHLKITEMQKRFADKYRETKNIEISALSAGYSKSYSNTKAYKLLRHEGIKKYLGRFGRSDEEPIAIENV